MSHEELKQAAIECLTKALKGDNAIPSHVVQAAVAIVLEPDKPKPGGPGST